MKVIRQVVTWLGVCDGNMEEGSLRCDANISLRPEGEMKFGTRTEIKNLNSFKFVEQAIDYEVARQLKILKGGGKITQETRLFDSTAGVTRGMRGKEESSDYRYFPDPDLPPLKIQDSYISSIKDAMPQLPSQRYEELINKYGLSEYDAGVLTQVRSHSDYYEEVYQTSNNPKLACNWVTSELFGALKKEGNEIEESPITAKQLGDLIKLIDEEVISGKMAKKVFEEMFETSKDPEIIIEEKGLRQITDENEILNIIKKIIDDNSAQLEQYLAGNEKLHGFFVGQIMKATQGSANPQTVNKLLKEELNNRK
ncbi:UNVERIFIED_CONTAM: hypothetical protein GTU68_029690 [Idotea baltica]|nr:hypothetical protein [Idotea baltica]